MTSDQPSTGTVAATDDADDADEEPEGPPPGYPARWETDVVLSDGGTVHVRPIRPDDADRLVRFHNRQSAESIYYRFFSAKPRLSEREVKHFTTLDYHDRMAFVAVLGDELVAVARYEPWGKPGQAEAAFIVDDAHHGRGLATLLLEYLMVAAKEAGYRVLTASTLAANTGMITVFKRAGFESTTRFEEGVVEVRFEIEPTEEAAAKIADRERRAEAASVARLLRPRSIAVVGASRTAGTPGHDLLRNLLSGGFAGPVYPVNEQADHVFSVPSYRSVADIAGDVDLAIVTVPAERVAEVVEACGRKRVGALVVLSAGVPPGWLAGAARGWGMRVLGPDSLGVVNTDPEVGLHAIPTPPPPTRAGTIAVSSQGPMLGAAVLAAAGDAQLGISSFVDLGDKADVSGNDLLQYWEGDERTSVVMQYVESVGNPRRFFRIARRVARRVPLVVVSTAGWEGEQSWLGSEASAYSSLLAQAGVIEVPTLGEMFDTARLVASQPLPRGPRTAIVAQEDGPATLAARAVRREGLEVANVVIVGEDEPLEEALVAVAGRDDVDAVVLLARVDRPRGVQRELDLACADLAKPVVAAWLGPEVLLEGDTAVPAFRFPEDGVRALARAAGWASTTAVVDDEEEVHPDGVALDAARELARAHLAAAPEGTALPLGDAVEVLAGAGISVIDQRQVASVDEAARTASQIGYPVALKAGARPKVARTEATGLALDLSDEAELVATYQRMRSMLGGAMDTALIQRMATPGVDAQVVAGTHPRLGPVVALGRGGAMGSRPDDLAVRLAPLRRADLAGLVASSTLRDGVAAGVLDDVLARLGVLVEQVPELAEVRLDPVIVSEDGVSVTDVSLRVAPWHPDPRPAVRRL